MGLPEEHVGDGSTGSGAERAFQRKRTAMLHHHTPAEHEADRIAPSPSLAVAETRRDAHVEDFLDRVFAHLVAVLPYEERVARRDAMRAQIEQSVAAHMELGSARHESLALTLAQVQREQAVASQSGQIAGQAQQTRTRPQPSDRQSTAIALGFFGLFYLLDQTRVAGHLWHRWFGGVYDVAGDILPNSASVVSFYQFELLVLPLICGLAIGLLAKNRPAHGALNALALLSIPAIVWGGLSYGLHFAGLLSSTPHWLPYIFPNPIPAVSGIGAWAVLGALSAGAGGWLRRRIPWAGNAARALGTRGRRSLRKPRWACRRHEIALMPAEPRR